ncbi:MAG: HigA family addiction module antitoxin [Gammaproteobacteria bacterium]
MIKQPVHPGKIVREVCLIATGLTVTQAAKKLGVDRTTFSRLINGHAGISAEMAMRLSLALNTSPTLWMNLQRDYDLWSIEQIKHTLHVERVEKAA